MKRHFKQLLVAFLALTMVLTGAMCVQAKTITKPAQTLTLYPLSHYTTMQTEGYLLRQTKRW